MQGSSLFDGVVPINDAYGALPHVFTSKQSGKWHLRQNKAALVGAGAIVLLNGRWMATNKFQAAVLEIAIRAAEKAAV